MVFEEPKAEFVEIDIMNNIVASGGGEPCEQSEMGGGILCSLNVSGSDGCGSAASNPQCPNGSVN